VLVKINGERYELEPETTLARLRAGVPEPIQLHWVEVDGVRFPVKQALELALGLDRSRFTSHVALAALARAGFATSRIVKGPTVATSPPSPTPPSRVVPASSEQAAAAFATLAAYLQAGPLSSGISALEHQLVNTDHTTAATASSSAGLTEDLLRAALIVRREIGRVSDVIHAATITLALPHILQDGELVTNRPSLGPGNDPTRPYDLETNQRVAEFKIALWTGGDSMRQRTLTADLVHLSLDDSGRRPELWVAGQKPIQFLRNSRMTVSDLLMRSSASLRDRYHARYGSDRIPLSAFTTTHAAHVQLCDIGEVIPAIASAVA
jgi:hypothetical protein